MENSPLGTAITYLSFNDKDRGRNGELRYSDNSGYFTINSTGHLLVDGPLDRETISTHPLTVIVCDNADNHTCTSTTFTVDIDDVNDNAPEFTSPAGPVLIPEHHACGVNTPIVNVTFEDDDTGNNSRISFSLFR